MRSEMELGTVLTQASPRACRARPGLSSLQAIVWSRY